MWYLCEICEVASGVALKKWTWKCGITFETLKENGDDCLSCSSDDISNGQNVDLPSNWTWPSRCPMFCVFWIYGSHVASLSFIFFGSCCTQLCILLVPMKLERFNFYAIQRIVVKEEIKLRKNNRELHRLPSSCGVCTTLRNSIMRWCLT